MRIENRNTRHNEPLFFPAYISGVHEQELEPEIVLNTSDEDINLREQILALQRTKALLGIENLAASELDRERLKSCFTFVRKWGSDGLAAEENPTWEDFDVLENKLSVTSLRYLMTSYTYAICEIVKKLDHFKPRNLLFSESPLMSTAIDKPPYPYALSEQAVINAAYALRDLVMKFGESLNDEAEIIKLLANAPREDTRWMGTYAAQETYKHKWRKNIEGAGLITALSKEKNDGIRERIAWIIAHANPKSILGEYHIEGSRNTFRPITRILFDQSLIVRRNLLGGLYSLLEAQRKEGPYYDDFSEVPKLTVKDKVDCFEYALKSLDGVYKKSSLTYEETWILRFSLGILVKATCKVEISELSNLFSYSDAITQYFEYKRQLAKIDFLKLIETTTKACFSGLRCKDVDFWQCFASLAVENILETKRAFSEKPLMDHFELRKGVCVLRASTRDEKVVANIDDAIQKIDNSIKLYITEQLAQTINRTTSTEFNLIVNDLLDILTESKDDSCKLAILDLFEKLNSSGLRLDDKGNVSLNDALDNTNKTKLRHVLSTVVYAQPVTKELFQNPQKSTLQGKALMLFRDYKTDAIPHKSYKDYHGMADLKQIGLNLAAGVITSCKYSKGLLLSGEPRTGKSMFATVLANQVALPLFVVKSSEILTNNSYLDEIKKTGCCVVLIDELEKIAPPSQSDPTILSFIKELQKLPVILIATTNSPTTDSIEGMPINEDGTSPVIDEILAERVHPSCLKTMQSCYLFHKKSVGIGFTNDYLLYLHSQKFPNKPVDNTKIKLFKVISAFGKGLIPKDIIDAINETSSLTIPEMISKLWSLQLGRLRILNCGKSIRETLSTLQFEKGLTISGPIDYERLAFLVEDILDEKIEAVLNTAPAELDQTSLLMHLSQHCESEIHNEAWLLSDEEEVGMFITWLFSLEI